MRYTLIDTFNDKELSRHFTISAAIQARKKHLRAVKKANGSNSYLTYEIRQANGEPVPSDELHAALWEAAREEATT